MLKYEKICSFFGHRKVNIDETLKNKLQKIIINLINNNVSIFIFGGFGEFDDICYNIVTELKKDFPFIKRVYCLSDERLLNNEKRNKYKYLSDNLYEEFVFYPPRFNFWYKSIYYRNLEIVDRSDFIIFFIRNKKNSGAYKTYKYAQKSNAQIIEL